MTSHRSREGCRTCRKRKVKCDESHPKCGPCKRLKVGCDWAQEWKFSDMNKAVKAKYVNLSGYDPASELNHSRCSSTKYDDLPDFAELITDEDREQKASFQPPGTFTVVAVPGTFESLADWPRTSCRRAIVAPNSDPNITILASVPDGSENLESVTTRSDLSSPRQQELQFAGSTCRDHASNFTICVPVGMEEWVDRLTVYYRAFLSKRIMPLGKRFYLGPGKGGTGDPLVAHASRFPPLGHAINAVSILSLALKGEKQLLPKAFQQYHQAVSSSLLHAIDLRSDGALYFHFLLLIYDLICSTQGINHMKRDSTANMWTQQIEHLKRITFHRQGQSNGDLQAYLLWYVLSLDVQATFSGHGTGEFVRAYLEKQIFIPKLKLTSRSMIPYSTPRAFSEDVDAQFIAVRDFSHSMCLMEAKLALVANEIRNPVVIDTETQTEEFRKREIFRLKDQLDSLWYTKWPSFLPRDAPDYSGKLEDSIRVVLEHALLKFSACSVYLHTSMYPRQRLSNSLKIKFEIADRCTKILSLASAAIEAHSLDHYHLMFPVFLAGYAAIHEDTKAEATKLMQTLEGTGISANATKSRELLVAVSNEQRARFLVGQNAEEVDWMEVAASKGIRIVNFGL